MRRIIDVLYVSRCGKYIVILRDVFASEWVSEWISTNKRGRAPSWNDLNSNKWIELDRWEVRI